MPNKLTLKVEQYGPVFSGSATFIVLCVFKDATLSHFVEHDLSIEALYSAVFDWASIQTGFLFGIFGFIASKGDGFIGEIRNSMPMKHFIKYTKWAIYIGFILTITSMPLIVLDKKAADIDDTWFYIIALWFSMFVWAFLAFARTAYIFGVLVAVEDRHRIKG
ncbi:hypothetical protein [Hartmannibacter diazotrophicus]|uniref:hypothetical protein n=1 Tax=Hartmannibacter diazotrophicus TaxID=1482074 RepID=UPI000C145B7D|nr:hypothetical protein [Hartmannibacter diazotrophicus]